MADKWEVVGPPKKRPIKPKAPIIGQVVNAAGPLVPGQLPQKQNVPGAGKPKRHTRKIPAAFPLTEDEHIVDSSFSSLGQKEPGQAINGQANGAAKKKPESQKKSQPTGNGKPKEKRRDLEGTLQQLDPSELLDFFRELQNAGNSQEVCLSWIKYLADALNTKLNGVIPPDVSQWPNNLDFPRIPPQLEQVLRTIISETGQTRTDLDILGVSFTSLLVHIPVLSQRGDPGWGYLLFLREMCRLDPSLPSRRDKSFSDIMESYGNRKEIGLNMLWSVAQSGVESPYVLKIASDYLLPYYGFKNYKQFVLAALETTTSSANMAVENLIEIDEFDEFFTAAFDPKKKRELEKIYPRVKELVLRGIKNQGGRLFIKFLEKVGEKDFSSVSPYGKEVFEILLGCLENDSSCVDTWRDNLSKYPKESAAFLNHLSKVSGSVKCSKQVETKFIQSDEFAIASVKNPELLRMAKKVQTGFEKAAKSKRKLFSWKMGIFIIFLTITGLLSLDVSENGKGSFENSNTGKLLKSYGILEQTMVGVKVIYGFSKYTYDHASVLFRSVYEGVRPVLQSLGDQVQIYIPQITEYLNIGVKFLTESLELSVKFLQEKVFVGVLSPDNLRKMTKESLSFIWGNIVFGMEKMYQLIEKYVT